MNDEDLRDLFAAFAMVSKMWVSGKEEADARQCYRMADAMIEAKYKETPEDGGIATVVKKPRKTKEQP